MTSDNESVQSSRLTCKIPTSLLLRVEDQRHVYMKSTGKRLTLRRVVESALEAWLSNPQEAQS